MDASDEFGVDSSVASDDDARGRSIAHLMQQGWQLGRKSDIGARPRNGAQKRRSMFMRVHFLKESAPIWFGSILLLLFTASCATSSLPSTNEMSEMLTARKTMVLLRITVDIDGKPAEAFGSIFPDDNVGVALIAGRHVRRIELYRCPSVQSRHEGWIYLIEEPGTYYLAVQPPRDRDRDTFHYQVHFRYAPRWRIDVLPGSRIIYAGRLHIDASTEKGFLFSRRVVYDPARMKVEDERALARDLAAKLFPELGPPVAVLMEPVGEPVGKLAIILAQQ
jgi:hypothetical protein